MITPIPLLQSVRVASPCNADWNEMQAVEGDRVHFCTGCGKNVYNLSAMSQREAEGLLRKHEGRLCVRYYQRRDGTVLTGDCPVGAQAVRMALIRHSAVAAGLFTLMFGAMAGINRAEMKQAEAPMGSIAVAPPPIASQVAIQSEEPNPRRALEPVRIHFGPTAIPAEEPKPEPVMGKMAVREPHVTMGVVAMPMKRDEVKLPDVQSASPDREAPEKDSTDEAILKSRNEK